MFILLIAMLIGQSWVGQKVKLIQFFQLGNYFVINSILKSIFSPFIYFFVFHQILDSQEKIGTFENKQEWINFLFLFNHIFG